MQPRQTLSFGRSVGHFGASLLDETVLSPHLCCFVLSRRTELVVVGELSKFGKATGLKFIDSTRSREGLGDGDDDDGAEAQEE